jgi:hypothetical protein
MNRLGNFFQSAKLAKLQLAQAKEDARNGHTDRAVLRLSEGMLELITAMNNVASIAFDAKPKGGKS